MQPELDGPRGGLRMAKRTIREVADIAALELLL